MKRRAVIENVAAIGLVLVCVSLALPFASAFSPLYMQIGKWVMAAGAIVVIGARLVKVDDPDESSRLRRLRRMEAWAGIAFAAATFFWFWNENRLGPAAGPLAVINDTIMFALAGAIIQIVASWMIVWRQKKEAKGKSIDEKK